MNIHEYQAKALLKEFGAPVSRGVPVLEPDDAEAAAKQLGGPLWVVKSQIHAGGRGKGKFKEAAAGTGGGVRLAKSIDDVKTFARQMLGATLVTIQTGPSGKQVNRLYLEEGSDIAKEFTCRCWSTARPRACRSWCRPKAVSISRTSPTIRPRRS
jgi:succinyl-CoA synthetase beta subunit